LLQKTKLIYPSYNFIQLISFRV